MGLRVVVSDKLRVQGLTEVHASEMRKRLTVTNPKWRSAVLHSGYAPQYIQIPRYITMYGDAGSALSIPRGMTLPAAYKVTQDDTVSAPVKFPKPVIELKTHQQVAYDYFVSNKGLRPFGTFLNVMEVSAGKTILSAMIARHLGQRTLILVHTALIMDAWLSDLCLLYGDAYRDKIGIIRGPKAFLGTHYTVAMCQTWFKRQQYWKEWFGEFGTMIFDECHLAPAKTFCDCANNCPAKYRIGITGTPKRKDGLHKIMYQVFGTPFYEQKSTGVETETSLPISDAVVIKTKTHLPAYIIKEIKYKVFGKEKTKFVKVPPDGQRDYLLILKTLERAKKRTEGIAKVVASILHTDKYACVLVSSHRRKHAHRLRNAIKKASGMGIALLIGALGNKRTAMYVRKLKARKLRCAVATTQFIKTGASIPPLNHLVITTPIGATQDLEQLSGRIRRKCVNKTFAKIWHVVDWNIPLCKRHFISKAVPLYRDKLHIPRFKNYYAG